MKRTGPTKESTRKLAVALEKYGKKKKEAVWLAIAEKLRKPRRARVKINMWKLGLLSEKFGGKILVVPGKVLGTGSATGKISVAAFEFSESAMDKIGKGKGEAIKLQGLMERNPKASSLVLVEQ